MSSFDVGHNLSVLVIIFLMRTRLIFTSLVFNDFYGCFADGLYCCAALQELLAVLQRALLMLQKRGFSHH